MNLGPQRFLWLAAATNMINNNGVLLGTTFQLSVLFVDGLLLFHGSHDLVQAHVWIQHQCLGKLGISDADNDPAVQQSAHLAGFTFLRKSRGDPILLKPTFPASPLVWLLEIEWLGRL